MAPAKKLEPSIAVIGAGMSGIIVGYRAQTRLKTTNYTIYEKEKGVGGTWFVNRYPGCACDVMSHLYSFSFERNPDWSMSFSPGEEIWRYCNNVAKKYGIMDHVKFGHELREAKWLEEEGMWKLSFLIHDLSSPSSAPTSYTTRHNFLVFGGGGLHYPKMPAYPGWETFKGVKAHSAAWPKQGVDLKGKDVAVIGTGASGVQVVESIAPIVGRLTVYQRSPGWCPPKAMFAYPSWVRYLFRYVPFLTLFYRLFIFLRSDLSFSMLLTGTWLQYLVKYAISMYYKAEIKDPELRKALTPSYDVGTKRILPQVTYLKDLQRPNVELVHAERIVGVDATGLWTEARESGKENGVANGKAGAQRKHRDHDVIIAATGFDVLPTASPVSIYGRGGIERRDKWAQLTGEKDLAMHYRTVMTSGFPNFFMLLGPNAGIGHISAVYMIECQVDLAMGVIETCVSQGFKALDPKEAAQKIYTERLWRDLKKTVWCGGTGRSWYNPTNRTDGKITTMYPYRAFNLYLETRSVDMNDFVATPL